MRRLSPREQRAQAKSVSLTLQAQPAKAALHISTMDNRDVYIFSNRILARRRSRVHSPDHGARRIFSRHAGGQVCGPAQSLAVRPGGHCVGPASCHASGRQTGAGINECRIDCARRGQGPYPRHQAPARTRTASAERHRNQTGADRRLCDDRDGRICGPGPVSRTCGIGPAGRIRRDQNRGGTCRAPRQFRATARMAACDRTGPCCASRRCHAVIPGSA